MSCRRHRAISLLLGYAPELLDFVFDEPRTGLRCAPRTLRREATFLVHDRQLLVQIALDIWTGTSDARLLDTCRLLAPHHYDCFLAAMEYLGATAATACRCMHCRTITIGVSPTLEGSKRPRSSARPATMKGSKSA